MRQRKIRPSVRILSVSDVVTPMRELQDQPQTREGIDLIISCGDLPPEYLSGLKVAFGVPLYYVCGNHDIRYGAKKPQGGMDLHGKIQKVKGLNFLGLEGSMWYNGGPFQYRESEMRTIIRRLRSRLWWSRGVDVIVTHAPPRGIHDQPDLCHTGFASFRRLIRKYRPAYFVHGHIHRHFDNPSERVTIVDQTRVMNTYGACFFEIENR